MAEEARRGVDFRGRARVEADRYGPDPWVFVRELLQNARDAGATAVEILVAEEAGQLRVEVRDDGEGMSYEHARRYLFALYASSKESRGDQAGRFGVGFWSILRFEPATITVRSRPRAGGEAWELCFGGDLSAAVRRTPTMEPGTHLILERGGGDGASSRRIFDAAWQNARFLRVKGDPERALQVRVNGQPIAAPFALPPPSASFHRAGLRGVVGLGGAARVELFSRGLRVRAAASLEDFISPGGQASERSRVHFTELPGRLAPQALLESDHLGLLLSRADAREDRPLRRLIALAQRELTRLVDRQLDAARPLPWWRRVGLALRLRLRASLLLRTLLAALLGAALAITASFALWGDRLALRLGVGAAGGAGEVAAVAASGRDYRDLAADYRGPQVDALAASAAAPIDMTYRPGDQRLYFAALIIDRFDAGGAPQTSAPGGALTPYVGAPCRAQDACVEVELALAASEGLSRVPVPTGYLLDPGSLRLDDRPRRAFASLHDEPLLVVDAPLRGRLRYTVVAGAPSQRSWSPPSAEPLPEPLRALAHALRRQPREERVLRLTEEVARRVAYSVEPEVAAAHALARARGRGLFARTIEIGRGDCDLQNALLVALLHEAGVEARLAIGVVGSSGAASPWLHAWAEHREEGGPWQVADASAGQGPLALRRVDQAAPASHEASAGTGAEAPAAGPGGGDSRSGEGDERGGAGAPEDEHAAADRGAEVEDAEAHAAAPRLTDRRGLAVSLGIVVAALGIGVAVLGLRRRLRREIVVEQGQDLSRLLMGVLQHPESFRGMPAVFQRPLVPVCDGRPISLDHARELARAGRLFRAGRRAPLVVDALRGGSVVLDDALPDACIVADALGASDLDAWDALLAAAVETPLLAAVNAHLAACDERWKILAAPGLGRPRPLDLSLLRLRRHPLRGRRLLIVDAADPWLVEAESRRARAPADALFAAVDASLDLLDVPPERRAPLLHGPARAAVLEAAERLDRPGAAGAGEGSSH